jgi:hypothetical protein
MTHVRRLFESRPFHKLVPDQSIILDGPTHGGAKIRAARATDGSFAFVYSPRGEPFTVRVNVIRTHRIRQTWFDPRTGTARNLHTTDTPGFQTFVPPSSGRGNDWILVLDDATAGFPPPGDRRRGRIYIIDICLPERIRTRLQGVGPHGQPFSSAGGTTRREPEPDRAVAQRVA